jgi:hypothetical protein
MSTTAPTPPGITLPRTSGKDEIWCRCDDGSYGIAEHAHAIGKSGKSSVCRPALSWITSAVPPDRAPEIQAEAR